MRGFLSILVSVVLTASTFGQQASNEISIDAIHFIKTVFHDKRDIYLSITPCGEYFLNEIKKTLSKNVIKVQTHKENGAVDTIVIFREPASKADSIIVIDTLFALTKIEKRYVDSCLDGYKKFQWTKEIAEQFEFPNVTLTNADSVLKGPLPILYYMIPPILIKNQSMCIFYKGWNDPTGFGGHGSLDIYKKENGVWKYLLSLTSWDS